MSRTYVSYPLRINVSVADELARKVLIAHNYREIQYGTEIVWKMGTGLATAMHYIKVEYKNGNELCLSGWVQIGLGSVGGKERDLTGTMGIIPKRSVSNTMKKIGEVVEAAAVGGYIDPGILSVVVPSHQPPQNTPSYTPPPQAAPAAAPQQNANPEMRYVFCQACGVKLRLPVSARALRVTCPQCKASFIVEGVK